jgi:hypothetical protein
LNQDNLRDAIALLEPENGQTGHFWATRGQLEKIEASKRFDLAKVLQPDSSM